MHKYHRTTTNQIFLEGFIHSLHLLVTLLNRPNLLVNIVDYSYFFPIAVLLMLLACNDSFLPDIVGCIIIAWKNSLIQHCH